MRGGTVVLAFVIAVMAGALGFVLWPNEERVIRGRLSDVASIISVPAGETDLARMERLAHLRDYLAPDVHLRDGSREATSREMVLGALAEWGRSPDALKVQFVDVQVTLDRSQPDAATAYLTATVTGRDSVDAREVDARLGRVNGKWIVTGAETRQTLTR